MRRRRRRRSKRIRDKPWFARVYGIVWVTDKRPKDIKKIKIVFHTEKIKPTRYPRAPTVDHVTRIRKRKRVSGISVGLAVAAGVRGD